MPARDKITWSRILDEIKSEPSPGPIDLVRRKKLKAIFQITGRPIVAYGTACTIPNKQLLPQMLSIDPSDVYGFSQIIENLNGPNLDILLHSPGGIAEAVESIVRVLRNKFDHIRFIIPSYAKSAATMLALSGNEIIMAPGAELGPIDPQMITRRGISPAQAILDQFDKATKEIEENPRKILIWAPILEQLGPALIVQSENAIKLGKEMVKNFLKWYMFKGEPDAAEKAQSIVDYLSNHNNFKSHGRRVGIDALRRKKVKVINLSSIQVLYNAVIELYCAIDFTFGNTPTSRLIENHYGDAIIRHLK